MLRKLFSAIQKIESYGSFTGQVFAILKLLVPVGLYGAAMTWVASISDALSDYAPYSWLMLGSLAAAVLFFALYMYESWRLGRIKIKSYETYAASPKSINPLQDTFSNIRIKADDFISYPEASIYDGKTFTNCEIVGSGSIMLSGCQIHPGSKPLFAGCNFVIVNEGGPLKRNAFVHFSNSTFRNCSFYGCIIICADLGVPLPPELVINAKRLTALQ